MSATIDRLIAEAKRSTFAWIKLDDPTASSGAAYEFVPASMLADALSGQPTTDTGQEGQPPQYPPDVNEPFTMFIPAGQFVNKRSSPVASSLLVQVLRALPSSAMQIIVLKYKAQFDAFSTNTYAPLQDGTGYVAINLLIDRDPALPFPPIPDSVTLDDPYDSQWESGANAFVNDCGPACVLMFLRWQAKAFGLSNPTLSIDDLSRQTTLVSDPSGLPTSALPTLAAKYNLPLVELTSTLTLDRIRRELADSRPVIALITYGYIPERMDTDPAGHFVMVIGYDATGFFLNDPDWWDRAPHRMSDGHDLHVLTAHLDAAMANAPVAYQGCITTLTPPAIAPVVVAPPPVSVVEQTMYVNMPGDVLIVHRFADHNPANYIKDPQDNNVVVALPDQKAVKVLVPATGLGEFAQIAGDNEPLAGYWLVSAFLSLTLRPVQPTPISAPTTHIVSAIGKCRPGLHIGGSGINHDLEGQIAGVANSLHAAGHPLGAVVVVDDITLANILAELVNVVVYRQYAIGQLYDGSKMTDASSASTYADWFYEQYKGIYAQLDKRIYLQPVNENDNPLWGGAFFLRFMQRATADGRLVAAFGDSTGTPTIQVFQARQDALRYGMANGHVYLRHNYSPFVAGKPSSLPVSTASDFQWAGGYHRTLYAAVPPDCQMSIIIGECGSSDAIYRGADVLVADMNAYNTMLQSDPVLGFCWWTAGKSWQSASWEINAALPQIESLVMSL